MVTSIEMGQIDAIIDVLQVSDGLKATLDFDVRCTRVLRTLFCAKYTRRLQLPWMFLSRQILRMSLGQDAESAWSLGLRRKCDATWSGCEGFPAT